MAECDLEDEIKPPQFQVVTVYLTVSQGKETRRSSPLSFHRPAPADSHSTSCFCGFNHQDSSSEREHILKYVRIFVCVHMIYFA